MENRRLKLGLVLVSLILVVLDSLGLLGWLHQGFTDKTSLWRLSLANKREESVISPQVETNENNLAVCRARLLELQEENQASRRLLGADLPPAMKFIPAHLLGASKNQALLDIGRDQAVKKEAPVLVGEVLLGRVVKTTSSTARVEFLNHPETRLLVGIWREKAAVVGEPAVVKAILKGGESMILEEILVQEEVGEGNIVASLDWGGRFVIGRIKKVWQTEDGLFKKAAVDWLANPRSAATVFVVKQ